MQPLPRGRHKISTEAVAAHQRARLAAATAESLHLSGYEGTTVARIAHLARVSKSDFYKHFRSKEDCFVATYEVAVDRLREEVTVACAGSPDWARRTCAALASILAFMSREPAWATVLLIEGPRIGPEVSQQFEAMLARFVSGLHDCGGSTNGAVVSSQAVDEAVVGGITALVAQRISAGDAAGLETFLPEIAEFALRPYVGSVEARRIISVA